MIINLRDASTLSHPQQISFSWNDRLPPHAEPGSPIHCEYRVSKPGIYFLLEMIVNGELNLICQRCLKPFRYPYKQETQLAVYPTEDISEKMLSEYDCIVSLDEKTDLQDLVVDELILNAPLMHTETADCDQETGQFITIL